MTFCLKKIRSSVLSSGLAVCLLIFYTLGLVTHNLSRTVSKDSKLLKFKLFPRLGSHDRIEEQLQYQPNSKKIKTILLLDEHKMWSAQSGMSMFSKKKCLVDTCSISYNPKTISKADLVITRGAAVERPQLRPDQLWMVYQLESPLNRPYLHPEANWTATFRRDSTVVAPYGKWVGEAGQAGSAGRDFAAGREGRAVWLVSNCKASNDRLEYAQALAKYFPVDIIGKCGSKLLTCSRGKPEECWETLAKKYKFYLSFENSNCIDYISEKFWSALKHKVLPIVMGARPEDYKAVAPLNSFLHVDNFAGPRRLAEHLTFLHENTEEYNKHFQWVSQGRMADTKFFCRVCAVLHHPKPVSFHSDIGEWWSPSQSCTNSSWTNSWSPDSL